MTAGQGQYIYCSRGQEAGVSLIELISRGVHSIDLGHMLIRYIGIRKSEVKGSALTVSNF